MQLLKKKLLSMAKGFQEIINVNEYDAEDEISTEVKTLYD